MVVINPELIHAVLTHLRLALSATELLLPACCLALTEEDCEFGDGESSDVSSSHLPFGSMGKAQINGAGG